MCLCRGKPPREADRFGSLPWQAGRWYPVARTAPLRKAASLKSPLAGTLGAGGRVLLVRLAAAEGGCCAALVLPEPGAGTAGGWLTLHDPKGGRTLEGAVLLQDSSETAWDVHGQYRTVNDATLRREPSLNSEVLGELTANEAVEILELDLGVSTSPGDSSARLRAKVRTAKGMVGWLSPETVYGNKLLVRAGVAADISAELRREVSAVSDGAHRGIDVFVGTRPSNVANAPKLWEVGARYQLPAAAALWPEPELALFQEGEPELGMAGVGSAGPGATVLVQEVRMVRCADRGAVPCALLAVEGRPNPPHGWAPCDPSADLIEAPRPPQSLEPYVGSGLLDMEDAFEDQPADDPAPSDRICSCHPFGGGPSAPPAAPAFAPSSAARIAVPRGAGAIDFGEAALYPEAVLGTWVRGVYARYNPAKLGRVEELLAEHRGREAELVGLIADKYRVRPLPKGLLPGDIGQAHT